MFDQLRSNPTNVKSRRRKCREAGGADLEIFPADVVAEIHGSTGGVPRLINALCALLLGACRDLQIDAANTGMVRQLADELMLSGFEDSRSSRLDKAAHW
jgi:hypothetical protein